MAKVVDARFRNFGCIVYEDTPVKDWLRVLDEEKIPAFVSPLHDSDIDPQDQPKTPHYHVMIMFEGKKSVEQAQHIFDKLGGKGVEKINSLRSYARYLCHLDNPNKAQYDPNNVICFGGADYFEIIALAYDKYTAVGEIMDFCVLNQIYSYAELCLYSKEHRYDWYRILVDKATVHITQFLKSLAWSDGILHNVDAAGNLINKDFNNE